MISSKRIRHDQNGFTTAWILGLVLLVLLVGATFYDIGQALVERQKLVTAADRAANAGAMAIDEQYLIDHPGEPIQLMESDDGEILSAPTRCLAAFNAEKSKLSSSINNVAYDCDVEQPYIIAQVKGDVSFGSIAGLLGVKPKTFTVISRAKPTCSNDDATSEAC